MSALDREILAERVMAVERHLARVAERLPADLRDLQAGTDAGDVVTLHLWQATQIVLDLALAACLRFDLGSPASYAEAFRRLANAGVLSDELAARLSGAAGFRNVVAHAYDTLDMARVHRAARDGPADLRACLAALATRL